MTPKRSEVIIISCYHPLKALDCGINPVSQKKILRFLKPSDFQFGNFQDDDRVLDIPCGQCIGCRMDYAREWANRLLLELQAHDSSKCFFVTLTYSDDALKDHCLRGFSDSETGEVKGYSLSLCKRDLQLFMKRLRKACEPEKIRFYAVGEYGGQTFRPHYHLILFNLHLSDGDLHFYKKSPLGYDYQNSDLIARVWPFGYNVVAPVTWESCCYTARYMLKKQKGNNAHVYDDFSLEAPFSVCSRKPGIAHSYFENCGDFSRLSRITIGTDRGSKQFPPPRYLERLFTASHPEEARERQRVRRLSALNREKLVLSRTDLSKDDYLEVMEKNFTKAMDLLYNYRTI